MAYQVIYKKQFYNKIASVLKYLEQEWNKKVADDFLEKLDKRTSTKRTTFYWPPF